MAILDDRDYSSEGVNLANMNKARQTNGTKRKVRIGVFEERYLESKCGANNESYDLVEINRAKTIREHFDYKDYRLDP